MDESASSPEQLGLPGFRFHPTEDELLDFYLKRKVLGKKHNDIIATLNLYRHDPWELPGLAKIGEREWFFFVPRDRKHPNGGRPNRTTEKGYWKATGSDKPVRSAADPKRIIGLRKTLVFYEGRSPRGTKTDWVMNEYRMPDDFPLPKEEDIVLCKIYRKATSLKVLEQRADDVKMHYPQGTPETASSSEQEINLSAPPVNLKREHDQHHDNNDDVSISNSFGWGTRKETREFGCGNNKFGLPELQLPNNKFSFDWLQDLSLTQLWSPWVEWPWTPFPPPTNAVDFYTDKQQS